MDLGTKAREQFEAHQKLAQQIREIEYYIEKLRKVQENHSTFDIQLTFNPRTTDEESLVCPIHCIEPAINNLIQIAKTELKALRNQMNDLEICKLPTDLTSVKYENIEIFFEKEK
jgi:hypothetical protein